MQTLIAYRFVVSLALSLLVGLVGLHVRPFPADNVLLELIQARQPTFYAGLNYTYATLWFSTPFLAISRVSAWLYIFVARTGRRRSPQVERASDPHWLVIPERGLYTGMAIVGAIGTGKTSACMYPYVEQLLAYRASDSTRRIGGLVLEVKGDFCRHVRDVLTRHGRGDDYIEVSLTSPYRYNPLHNDLHAYALAYGIATLMTNLFGRGHRSGNRRARTCSAPRSRRANGGSPRRTGASSWTSASICSRPSCRRGRGTTTIRSTRAGRTGRQTSKRS
jgi:hypothetical protein